MKENWWWVKLVLLVSTWCVTILTWCGILLLVVMLVGGRRLHSQTPPRPAEESISLTPEQRQRLERLEALFSELRTQIQDAEAQLRALQQLEAKVLKDANEFQQAVFKAHGVKAEDVFFDVPGRKLLRKKAALPAATIPSQEKKP